MATVSANKLSGGQLSSQRAVSKFMIFVFGLENLRVLQNYFPETQSFRKIIFPITQFLQNSNSEFYVFGEIFLTQSMHMGKSLFGTQPPFSNREEGRKSYPPISKGHPVYKEGHARKAKPSPHGEGEGTHRPAPQTLDAPSIDRHHSYVHRRNSHAYMYLADPWFFMTLQQLSRLTAWLTRVF